jgi:hypothetical protein
MSITEKELSLSHVIQNNKMNTQTKNFIPSPFQTKRKMFSPALTDMNKRQPVREEITKNLRTINFTAVIEEDKQTLNAMNHIPGIVAFICTLKRGNMVIAQGRGSGVINRVNKYFERIIATACNASLIDALIRSVKIDAFHTDMITAPNMNQIPGSPTYSVQEPNMYEEGITDRQKSYLTELIQSNIQDEDEKERWMSQMSELSKEDASQAIASFVR